jgi:hypothetical protein
VRTLIVALTVTVLAGCGDDPDGPRRADVEPLSPGGAVKTHCDVGGSPKYYVPAGNREPLVIGCAELRASGKSVEFSANAERIGANSYVCINAAYWRGGDLGDYIPSVCVRNPVREQLDVIQARLPVPVVRGYEWVTWGTVGPSARRVYTESADRVARAALFEVGKALAGDLGADEPFSVFAVELPVEAACQEVAVRASPAAAKTSELIDPRPRRHGPPRWCDPM